MEVDSVLSKAVNIVTRSAKGCDGHYQKTSSRYGRQGIFFFGAGPAGTGPHLADHTSHTTIGRTQEEENRPLVTLLQERRSVQPSGMTEHRQKPPKVQSGPQQLDSSYPHEWSITQDLLILETVQRYRLPFKTVPPDTCI